MKKQIILVAAQSLQHFLNEIPTRFKDIEPIMVYRIGRVETPNESFRFINSENSLRGFHGIRFEVWGPPVKWITDDTVALIRHAEMP